MSITQEKPQDQGDLDPSLELGKGSEFATQGKGSEFARQVLRCSDKHKLKSKQMFIQTKDDKKHALGSLLFFRRNITTMPYTIVLF